MSDTCKVIEFGAPRRQLTEPQPENVWQLRWRVMCKDGVSAQSAWTPEMRYPSITAVLEEFEGRVAWLAIDGRSVKTGEPATFLRVPGHLLDTLSYKMFGAFNAGERDVVGGIEVESVTGERYLVLRNGTIHVEEAG